MDGEEENSDFGCKDKLADNRSAILILDCFGNDSHIKIFSYNAILRLESLLKRALFFITRQVQFQISRKLIVNPPVLQVFS